MRTRTIASLILTVLLVLPAVPGRGQDKPAAKPSPAAARAAVTSLSIDLIMTGEEFVGTEPSDPVWAVDGKTLYFRWKRPGDARTQQYAVTLSDPVPKPVGPADLLKLPPVRSSSGGSYGMYRGYGRMGADLEFDKPGKRALFLQAGDVFLLDLASGTTRQLTATDERESAARFTFDGKKVAYTQGDNLFVLSLTDGAVRQMTSFSRTEPPAEKKPDAVDKMYAEQQKDLFKEVGRGGGRFPGMRGGAGLAADQFPRRKPHLLEESERISGLELSPDEKHVTFVVYREQDGTRNTVVPNYVTRSGYTETVDSHPKAAYTGQDFRAGAVSVETGEVSWLDYGQGDRKVFPGGLIWSPDGTRCLVTAQSEDRKDGWLLTLDPASGKTSVVVRVHDDAWVGPLGLTNVFWWPDSQAVSFISEKDGYAHLYKVRPDGKDLRQLTKGPFEVREASLAKDGKRLYLTTNEEHSGETHLYWMPAGGGERTKITSLPGQNEAVLSPDENSLALIRSYSNKPAELYLQANSPDARAKQVTVSTTDQFRSYPWYDPEVITFKARDGVTVHARLFEPVKQAPSRPAVIFIHGAGYLQNAHRGWSSYFREYMFHNFLMEQGYYVLDVDYRGSSGYGRDFRTSIYRHMGGKDLEDVVDAAKYMADKLPVDPARVGCYGGSYGGFLTLMALFKAGDVFKAGAALRPVTDWAHYHAGYTEDILNLPQNDPEAFKQSSPIYFAEGLKGALLICHGMADTNVHFQDTVRLAQRLIELGKENWDVAFYPVENHTFTTPSAWTDEYKRIFKLFERELK